MPSGDFSQSREDAIDAEMQREERREMQDPEFAMSPWHARATEGGSTAPSNYLNESGCLSDLDESCLANMTDAESADLEYAQDAAGDDWHLCMLTPQPLEYEL